MNKHKIKLPRGTTARIGRELGVSRQAVFQVVMQGARCARVEKAVCSIVGIGQHIQITILKSNV